MRSGAETSSPSTADSTEIAGCDHAVAEEQAGTGDADKGYGAFDGAANGDALRQRHQRQDATLAAIVRAHDQDDVFQRDDNDQRPEDQRQHAHDFNPCRRGGVEQLQARLEGIERTGADIAVDDTQHRHQHTKARLGCAMKRVLILILAQMANLMCTA